jgi:hypothetical protein
VSGPAKANRITDGARGQRRRGKAVPPFRGGRPRRAATRRPTPGRRPWRATPWRRRPKTGDAGSCGGTSCFAVKRPRPRTGDGNTQTKAKSPRQNPSHVGGKGKTQAARTGADASGKATSTGKHPVATQKQPRASSRARRREGLPATLSEASGSATRILGLPRKGASKLTRKQPARTSQVLPKRKRLPAARGLWSKGESSRTEGQGSFRTDVELTRVTGKSALRGNRCAGPAGRERAKWRGFWRKTCISMPVLIIFSRKEKRYLN